MVGKLQALPQRDRHELLENLVHVHEKAGRADLAATGLECPMPQDEPRERRQAAVVLVQAVEPDLRHGAGRKGRERHVAQRFRHPGDTAARIPRTQPQRAETVSGRLHQAVQQDVDRELVVAHLHRQAAAEPATDLVVEPDAPAHGRQRILLGAVAVEQPARERPAGRGAERQRERVRQRRVLGKVELARLEPDLPYRIACERQKLPDADLGRDAHRQSADIHGAYDAAGGQRVLVGCAGERRNGETKVLASQ